MLFRCGGFEGAGAKLLADGACLCSFACGIGSETNSLAASSSPNWMPLWVGLSLVKMLLS